MARRRTTPPPPQAVSEPETADEMKEQSIGELTKGLAEDVTTLVRQEMDLARAEMRQKGRELAPGGAMLGAAAAVGLTTLGALTAFIILALSTFMDAWLAALIVTIVWALAAYLLYRQGNDRVREVGAPVPEQMPASVKEDVETAKTRFSEGRNE